MAASVWDDTMSCPPNYKSGQPLFCYESLSFIFYAAVGAVVAMILPYWIHKGIHHYNLNQIINRSKENPIALTLAPTVCPYEPLAETSLPTPSPRESRGEVEEEERLIHSKRKHKLNRKRKHRY